MLLTRHLAGEARRRPRSRTGTPSRRVPGRAGVRTSARKLATVEARCRAGRSRPRDAATSALRSPRGPPGGRVAKLERAQPHVTVGQQPDRPAGGQWSLPDDLLDGVHQDGSSTASPSFTPPARAGQVDDQAAADDAGEPARQHRGRDALARRRAARIASAMPGTSRSSSGAGDLGRAVGRGQPGAAGGEHDAGAAGDGGGDRGTDRLAVGHDDRRVARRSPAG